MIIGLWTKEEINSIIEGTYSRNSGEEYKVRVYILRESNFDEWLQYRKQENLDILPEYLEPCRAAAYYYQVSID